MVNLAQALHSIGASVPQEHEVLSVRLSRSFSRRAFEAATASELNAFWPISWVELGWPAWVNGYGPKRVSYVREIRMSAAS